MADNEVIHLTDGIDDEDGHLTIDDDVLLYLKSIERFDYRDICVYWVGESNDVWIENFNSD